MYLKQNIYNFFYHKIDYLYYKVKYSVIVMEEAESKIM